MFRRIAALIVGAFTLNLNAQRADIACADHGERASKSTEQAEHVASHEHHAVGTKSAAPDSGSCDTPVQTDCCQALVSCSTFVDVEASVSQVVKHHDAPLAVALAEPHSRGSGPEPPPPRA